MRARSQRLMDGKGLNLIRIVVGSYYMAISLGLISGLEPHAILPASLDTGLREVVAASVLFAISAAFMAGYHLRISAICLALFVLSASVIQYFVLVSCHTSLSCFWRDLSMVCGILLSYTALKPHELGRALIQRRVRPVSKTSAQDVVRPRRVVPAQRTRQSNSSAISLAPLLQQKRSTASSTGMPTTRTLADDMTDTMRAAKTATALLATLADLHEQKTGTAAHARGAV